MHVLDVGCGAARDARATAGIDVRSHPGVDSVHDLRRFPWPLEDNRFDLIICRDIIEHLDDIVRTMEELHRIATPGGRIEIWTPHYSHPNSFDDPTHHYHFTLGSFDYFTGDRTYPRYSPCRFRMANKQFLFDRHELLGKLLARLNPRRYEKQFAHLFPPRGLLFEIDVLK